MATAPNLMRKQYLVSEDNIKKIQALASTKGMSAGNIVRLAIDAYDPTGFDDMDSPELMDFVSTRLKEAISATKKANRKVSRALKTINKVEV